MSATLSEFNGIPLVDGPGIGALTLGGFVREVSERFGEHEANFWRYLSGEMRRYSYHEFLAECRKVGKALLALGVAKDTRLGILASICPEIAGAAVIPVVPVSVLNAPGMMIGYRAAEFILGDKGISQDYDRSAV